MGQPCSSSQARRARSWSYVVPKSRHSVLDRAVITHPAQTRRQLRRMAINPTTHGVHNLHDVDLLEGAPMIMEGTSVLRLFGAYFPRVI